MYNSKSIEAFIEKVNTEAEKAAQEIYDKYTPELELRIKNQLQKGDIILIRMGTSCFKKDTPWGYADNLLSTIAQTQYTQINAGFNLPDIYKK